MVNDIVVYGGKCKLICSNLHLVDNSKFSNKGEKA